MKIAINTETQAQYDALMKYYDEREVKWFGGMPTVGGSSLWRIHEKNTCTGSTKGGVAYSSKKYYEGSDYTVIPFTAFAEIAGIKWEEAKPEKTAWDFLEEEFTELPFSNQLDIMKQYFPDVVKAVIKAIEKAKGGNK